MKKHDCPSLGWRSLTILVLAAGMPAATAVEIARSSLRSVVRPPCDEVCELQSQDRAFALLTEAYRQYRGYQIQSQFEARRNALAHPGQEDGSLVIATSLDGLNTVRDWLLLCFQVDRNRQLRELATKLSQMRVAYSCVRRADQEDLGEIVPLRVDEEAASELLRQFDLIAFGSARTGPLRLVKSVPASRFLYDAPRLEPDLERVAEACDDPGAR